MGEQSVSGAIIYVFTSAAKARYAGRSNINAGSATSRLVPRIAHHRLAVPEQQHQQNTEHAHQVDNRLVQNDLDDAGPEPRRLLLPPSPKSTPAGLVHVIPACT